MRSSWIYSLVFLVPTPYPSGACPVGCTLLPLAQFTPTRLSGGSSTYDYPSALAPVAEIQGDSAALPSPVPAPAQFDFSSAGQTDTFSVTSPSAALNLPCAIAGETLAVYAQPTGSSGLQIACSGSENGASGPVTDALGPQVFQSTSTVYSDNASVSCEYGQASPWSGTAEITAITLTTTPMPDLTPAPPPLITQQQSPHGDQLQQCDMNGVAGYSVGFYGCSLASLVMATAAFDPYLQNSQLCPVDSKISYFAGATNAEYGFAGPTSPDLEWISATALMTPLETAGAETAGSRMVFDTSYFGDSSPKDLADYFQSDGVPVIVKVHSEDPTYKGKPVSSTGSDGGHFVVVRGIQNGEFLINDPAFGFTRLSQFEEFSDGPWFVIRGKAEPSALVKPKGLRASGSFVLTITGAGLLVQDPSGNRTGIDPTTRTVAQDIPGSFFAQDNVAASDGSGDTPAIQYVGLPQTSGGNYQVKLSGLTPASASLQILQLGSDQTIRSVERVLPRTVTSDGESEISITLGPDGAKITR